MKKDKWMNNLSLKKGALRKTLGVKKGKDIPMKELNEASEGKGITAKRARLAKVFRNSFHGKKGKND
jgi:hypothetical protein